MNRLIKYFQNTGSDTSKGNDGERREKKKKESRRKTFGETIKSDQSRSILFDERCNKGR